MDGLWSPPERFLVESRLDAAVIGSTDTVRRGLDRFLKRTQADELILTSDLYDHSLRLRSFEIAAGILRELHVGQPA
jgi:alkanesulfonate monooxygenase SsuD/methylene tetrahydromethanopterin reductase-like flavin-dependent oxidoreductase (luciferase family)